MRIRRTISTIIGIISFVVLTCFLYFPMRMDVQKTISKQAQSIHQGNNIWERAQDLGEDGKVQIFWNFTEEDITMLVIGRTNGYVGVGFTHTKDMAQSDIIVGWVTDGRVHLKDLYGVKNGVPLEDCHQDYHLLFGGENETHTWFCFNRKLNTNDLHDVQITMSTFHVIWAVSDKDVLVSGFTEFDYHGNNRGMQKVLFLYLSTRSPPMTPDIEKFDIRIHKRRVRRVMADLPYNYYCKFVKIPNFGERHHLIGMETLLSPIGKKFIHHINLYGCEPGVKFKKDIFDYKCYTGELREDLSCVKPISGTAFGEKISFVPIHLGIPFGSTDEQPMYLRMEVHYDLEKTNYSFVDNSGARLFHTRKLRPNSLGPMGILARPMYIIPPKSLDFPTFAIASPECTKALFPKEGIHIAGVYMHSHHYVEKVIFYHFRNNKEINRISEDHFDFNFQKQRWLKEEIVVLQNDLLIYECIHNTTGRLTSMYPLLGAKDDMCDFFSLVYPEIPYSIFTSGLVPNELHNFFKDIPSMSIYKYNRWVDLLLQIYHSIGVVLYALDRKWTQKEISDYKIIFRHGQYSAACHFDDLSSKIIQEELRLPHISSSGKSQ